MSIVHSIGGVLVATLLSVGGLVGGAVPTPTPTPTTPVPASSAAPGSGSKAENANSDAVTRAGGARSLHPQTVNEPGTPPQYDNWASAYDGGFGQIDGTLDTRDATTQPGEQRSLGPSSRFEVYNSVWVKWTAPGNGVITADTLPSGSTDYVTDTTLAVFSGTSFKKLKRLAYNDDATSERETSQIIGLPVKWGNVYYFQLGVSGVSGTSEATMNGRAGYIDLTVQETFTTPVNDSFGSPTTETGSSWFARGSTLAATVEPDEDTDNPTTPGSPVLTSVWYRWVPAASGTFTVMDQPSDLVYTSLTSSFLGVYELDGVHGGIGQEWGAQNVGNNVITTTLPIYANETYYFQVGEVAAGHGGPFNLDVTATYTGPIISKLSSSHGSHKGSQKVTITGQNLSSVTSVCFGPFNCVTPTSVTAKKLVAKAPATPVGEVGVFVISPGTESNLNSHTNYTFK
jgi:hypothetical protein